MNKLTLIVIGLLLISSNAFCDNIIIYGKSTYGQVGSKIVFGSLGDEYAVSEFNGLGANDWIPENSFKNVLAYEGYTEAYDYNPSYDGYYANFYNKTLPNKELKKITIRGLGANPRENQDVYVLQDEWNKFSSQSQNNRINTNKKTILKERRKRIKTYKKLQRNINKEKQSRIKGDKRLRRNINKIDNKHTVINKRQDSQINNNTSNINNNSQRIDDTNNRVSNLEETQYRIDAEVQIKDTRNWRFSAFINNDVRHGRVDAVGVKVTYKLGKDYAVKRMDKLERKIDIYIELKKQENVVVVPTENGFAINTKF